MPGAPEVRLGRKRPLFPPLRGASSPTPGRGRGAQTFPFLPGQKNPACLDGSGHQSSIKIPNPRPRPLLTFSLLFFSLTLAEKRKRSPFAWQKNPACLDGSRRQSPIKIPCGRCLLLSPSPLARQTSPFAKRRGPAALPRRRASFLFFCCQFTFRTAGTAWSAVRTSPRLPSPPRRRGPWPGRGRPAPGRSSGPRP